VLSCKTAKFRNYGTYTDYDTILSLENSFNPSNLFCKYLQEEFRNQGTATKGDYTLVIRRGNILNV
jgi:hypothetical protein